MRHVFASLLVVVAALPGPANAQARVAAADPGGTTAVITGQGVVSRPPDMATLGINITTNNDTSVVATSANSAVTSALQTTLAPLGVAGNQIRTTYYNVTFTPRPVPAPVAPQFKQIFGYVVSRQMQINVTTIANVGKIVEAAVSAGATSVNNVSFGLTDRTSANEAALELAIADAGAQAMVLARASHLRLIGIRQIAVNASANFPAPGPFRIASTVPQMTGIDLPPTLVDVRASVTVTYLLK